MVGLMCDAFVIMLVVSKCFVRVVMHIRLHIHLSQHICPCFI